MLRRIAPILTILCACLSSPPRAAADDAGDQFFESRIRPLLVERCYKCHSATAKKLKGGLYADSRDGLLKGGDSGPAIVPSKPAESRLVEAIGYGNVDLQMPPKDKLSDQQIADLTKWVAIGAPWPTDAALAKGPAKSTFDLAARKAAHWAWQPIKVTPPPQLKNTTWPRDPIDNYILAALEARNLTPAPDADRRTLIRRAYFDLIGLPPSPADVAAFLADESPDAFAKVVDRLLASPQFGERWARHCMDLVRYAETFGHEFDYPIAHAWRYRDYLIRAFNADVPYNQVVTEQIAGDLLPNPRRHPTDDYNESIIGTGFWYFGEQVQAPVDVRQHQADRLDNQIDVMGKTFLALTLGCARCHDHKFDAISQKDVYGLWGFLESTRRQEALLDPGHKIQTAAAKLKELREQGTSLLSSDPRLATPDFRSPTSDTILFKDFKDGTFDGWYVSGQAFGDRPVRAGEWDSTSPDPRVLQFTAAHSGMIGRRLTGVLRSPDFIVQHDTIWYHAAGKNARIRLMVDGFMMDEFNSLLFADHLLKVNQEQFSWIRQRKDVARYLGHRAHIEILDDGDASWIAIDEIRFSDRDATPPPLPTQLSAPISLPPESASRLTQLAEQMRAIDTNLPDPMRVLAAQDGDGMDERVFIRGSPKNLGDPAPRRFLEALAGPDQSPVGKGCGRLELARRMTDPSIDPLLARVMVNRLWHHLFGRGIVPSTDNFGVLGSPPSHPELLDFLADRFVREGWSVKRALREMILSHSYAMSSAARDPAAEEADPQNVLLHRASIRRLEGEAIRDQLLSLSGRLDLTMYGPPVEVYITEFMEGRGRSGSSGPMDGGGRRSIYTAVRRNFLPPMMLAFDTPVPFSTMGRRSVSNVPAQALILMNDPLVLSQANLWARRTLAAKDQSPAQRITAMYESAFCRPPTEREITEGLAFLHSQAAALGVGESDPRPWADYAHVLINAKEFIFLN